MSAAAVTTVFSMVSVSYSAWCCDLWWAGLGRQTNSLKGSRYHRQRRIWNCQVSLLFTVINDAQSDIL